MKICPENRRDNKTDYFTKFCKRRGQKVQKKTSQEETGFIDHMRIPVPVFLLSGEIRDHPSEKYAKPNMVPVFCKRLLHTSTKTSETTSNITIRQNKCHPKAALLRHLQQYTLHTYRSITQCLSNTSRLFGSLSLHIMIESSFAPKLTQSWFRINVFICAKL